MNTSELKQAINEDINTLKSLDLEIMPSQEYYRENLILFKKVYLRMYLPTFFAALISLCFHWKEVFYQYDTWYGIAFAFGGPIILTGFIFLFIQDSLNNYVIFYHQIRQKLKTGELIDQQIRRAGWLAYKIFALVVIVPTLFFHPGSVLFAEFGAYFVSATITGIIIEMEMKRIGISTLFTLIKHYFDKDKSLLGSDLPTKR